MQIPKSSNDQLVRQGQEQVYALEDEEVVMTARLSKEADRWVKSNY